MMEPVALNRLTALEAVLTEDEILTRNTVRQFVVGGHVPPYGGDARVLLCPCAILNPYLRCISQVVLHEENAPCSL